MDDKAFKKLIIKKLQARLITFGIKASEVKDDFDLVKSGLMDSMSFVDFVGQLEEEMGRELDFDEMTDDDSITTVKGLGKFFDEE
ncbi:MAG: acyl carrier protein [Bacteroidales bacterium]